MKSQKRIAGKRMMATILTGSALFLVILNPVQAQNGAARRPAVAERLDVKRLGHIESCVLISCKPGQKFEGDEHDDLIECENGRACIPEGAYREYKVACATLENGKIYCSKPIE